MKKFLSKIKETNGYKELKVFFQQKIDAEVGRIAKRYNEKQQVQEQQAAQDDAQATPNDLANALTDVDTRARQEMPAHIDTQDDAQATPNDLANALTGVDTRAQQEMPAHIDTQLVASADDLQQVLVSDTVVLTDISPLADATGERADQIETVLVTIPEALTAIDFGDSSDADAEPVLTVGTAPVEHI